MAYRILKNTSQKTLMLFTADNTAIVVVGNNSVSEIGLASVTANIEGVSINQVWSSADSGAGANGWDITRGSNTVWQTDSTSWLDFSGLGAALDVDSAATLGCERQGSRGTLLLELQKQYAGGHRPSDSTY